MHPIDAVLSFDAVAEAEKIAGSGTDESMMLALGLQAEKSRIARALLMSYGDTAFSNTLEYYLQVATSIGFRTVLELSFEVQSSWDKSPRNEKFFVMWHDEWSILLCFDTYGETNINGGNFYYNIELKPDYDYHSTSSGMFADVDARIWTGHHDCREALKHKIGRLADNGTFLKKWKVYDNPWFIHHGDTNGDYDYEKYQLIREERFNMLPEDVKAAIRPAS